MLCHVDDLSLCRSNKPAIATPKYLSAFSIDMAAFNNAVEAPARQQSSAAALGNNAVEAPAQQQGSAAAAMDVEANVRVNPAMRPAMREANPALFDRLQQALNNKTMTQAEANAQWAAGAR